MNSRTVGGLNALSRGTGLDSRDQTLAASAVTTLGGRTLNELRLQLTRSRRAAPANDGHGPAVNIRAASPASAPRPSRRRGAPSRAGA